MGGKISGMKDPTSNGGSSDPDVKLETKVFGNRVTTFVDGKISEVYQVVLTSYSQSIDA